MPRTSKACRKATAQDVEQRAWHAFSSGHRHNPYPVDDKRHPLFTSRLARIVAVDWDCEDLHKTYGCDTRSWARLEHPDPGPVRPIEQLALH